MKIRPAYWIVASAIVCLRVTVVASADLTALLPADVPRAASQCIHSIYSGQFKEAEQEARRLVKAYPDHPVGYFFSAVVLDVWMEYYQSSTKEAEFYRFCDLAIAKGEEYLDNNPTDPWARFFIGGADGYKGTYESRQGRYITAFRYGWKGVSVLMELAKSYPGMHDLNYGIGSYEYWRSAMTQTLRWMPGVEDKRVEGIRKLVIVKDAGLFTRLPACAQLVAIYCNEKQYEKALDLANEMIGRFPRSLVFYWGKGEALFGLGRFEEAETVYRFLLGRVEAEPFDNHHNAVVCHYWLSKIYLATKNYTQSVAACNRMRYYRLDPAVEKRLEKLFKESDDVRKQATRSRTGQVESGS